MSLPDRDPTIDLKTGFLTRQWLRWASDTDKVVEAVRQSGTTPNRPTKDLFIGRSYFDTDLGIPVYVQSVGPVVWADSQGNPA